MKKIVLITLLAINVIVADSWLSGWEIGGTNTYEVSNNKGDTLKIYCNDMYTAMDLNEDNSDVITLVNNENMKFVSDSHLSPDSSGLSDELALDNFLYEVSNGKKFTIIMGKERAEFNITKNNVNNEILKECGMDKLRDMQNE